LQGSTGYFGWRSAHQVASTVGNGDNLDARFEHTIGDRHAAFESEDAQPRQDVVAGTAALRKLTQCHAGRVDTIKVAICDGQACLVGNIEAQFGQPSLGTTAEDDLTDHV
jgi:hypothetical protein